MNLQIKIFLTTSFWLFLFSFSVSSQTLKIKIHNKTGQNIDSLMIGDKYIGDLSKDSVTAFLDYERFNFDTGIPNEGIFGVIRKTPVRQLNWSMCGTEWHTETTGNYIFDLVLREKEEVDYFLLDHHVN
jgi:hypothetical protein